MSPIGLLQEAIRAVPALKYALGVCGLLAVVAIGSALRLNPALGVFGTLVTLFLMVVLVVFAKLTTIAPRHFLLPVLVMMWSALVVMLVSVALLASYVYFGKPEGLRHWIPPRTTAGIGEVGEGGEGEESEAEGWIRSARMQAEIGDYAGAWATLEDRPGRRTPPSVREARVDVAMAWMRDMEVVGAHTFAEIVDRIAPSLREAAGSATGQRAADIAAHLGWGAYLERREGTELGVDVEAYYRRALVLEPGNVFALTMLGRWILSEERGTVAAARKQFAAALASQRERAYVRDQQLYALRNADHLESKVELVRVLNEMREGGESLPTPSQHAGHHRWRLLSELYYFDPEEVIPAAAEVVSDEDQLATFRWLEEPPPAQQFRYPLAILLERAGHLAEALDIYQSLLPDCSPSIEDEVKAGVVRCTEALSAAGDRRGRRLRAGTLRAEA